MDKKQLEEFEFDICSLHEYFFDQNKERMEAKSIQYPEKKKKKRR